ncbi:MAG TPA: DUF4432 domain-containing protein [Clostridiales bacterium]|nr:DUF4432 domain-containing protein [Clostridiales bacterium]
MSQSEPTLSYLEQLRHVGSLEQLYFVRRLTLQEGPGAGVRLIEVGTSAGLRAVFCESRALDLYELNYRGVNLGFLSKNGLIAGRVQNVEGEFTPTWPGGCLVTCGLRNAGNPCRHNGEYHQAHGRIAGMPAEQVSVDLDPQNGKLVIKGVMRESALFGHNLILRRRIEIGLQGASVSWQDTVENQAAEAEPVIMLYHFNFGYPFLSPALQLSFPAGQVIPRTDAAKKGLAEFDQICEPVDGYPEQVFFHLPHAVGTAESLVRLHNPHLGLTANLTFDKNELPVLVQWKSMKSGDYALGIEPGTSRIRGRAEELADGYDQILPGFGQRNFHLSLKLE